VTRTMRINFILPGYLSEPIGGYKVIYDHANFLVSKGHRVRILFPRSITTEPLGLFSSLRARASALKRRYRHRPLVAWHPLDRRVQLQLPPNLNERYISDADVTVATAWSTADPVVRLPVNKGSKFYFIQGYETWAGDAAAVDATWRLPLHKIVVSKWLQGIGTGLGAVDIAHITNGLDLSVFRTEGEPAKRPLSLLAAYHTGALKGLSDTLAALKDYHGRFPDVPIAMFGNVQHAEGLPPWIEYHGGLSGPGLAALYNRHSVFISASLSEGWALTPAEAMACGCAFVGTDSGGVTDYATDGETALLSPPSDPGALLANLVRVTQDEGLLRRLQRAGHARIQDFTLERSSTAFEQRLMAKSGARP
jgi:glycosyltransferase involved in cell wall biosynthesis